MHMQNPVLAKVIAKMLPHSHHPLQLPPIDHRHIGKPSLRPIHPHSSMTGLNHAVSIHFLASIDNGGYFEADLSVANKFRDELGSEPWKIGSDGCVRPLDKPGIGVEIDEKFLEAHPVIEGPGYV